MPIRHAHVLRGAPATALLAALMLAAPNPRAALAWGDEGHRIVGRIALPLLTPQARAQVDALLTADAADNHGVTGCGPTIGERRIL